MDIVLKSKDSTGPSVGALIVFTLFQLLRYVMCCKYKHFICFLGITTWELLLTDFENAH
jgi:hypothetical protein